MDLIEAHLAAGKHRAKGCKKPAAVIGALAFIGTMAGLTVGALATTGLILAAIGK